MADNISNSHEESAIRHRNTDASVPEELIAKVQHNALDSLSYMRPTDALRADDISTQANAPVRASAVQKLQKTHGNRAVQRFLQSADTVNEYREDNVVRRLQIEAGRGSNLDKAAREKLENSLGADLSGVNIHTDSEADRLARSMHAVAFTTGQDIFFRAGMYDPHGTAGMHLIAHEVAHTLQQSTNPLVGVPSEDGVSISGPHDSFEKEAHQVADNVVTGMAGSKISIHSAPTVSVAREDEQSWFSRLWNPVSNNALSGGINLLAEGAKSTAPILGSARAGGVLNTLGNLRGVGMANSILGGPVSLASGIQGVYNALSADDYNLGTWGDVAANGAGAFSGAVGTAGMAGAGLTAAGATGVGGALSAGATALGPAAAVAAAGAGGYALGGLLDSGVDWLGDAITGNDQGDHSISGLGADAMTGIDRAFTGGMRSIGAYDESAPEYTQTLGWRLAEALPSWLQ